jgi:hypothetical protein
MLSNNLDTCAKNDKTPDISTGSNLLTANINIESLDIANIKRETYYKMKFIINCLEKNMAIKKRKTIFYLKNLEDSTTEIITEDYLNKRIIHKIYNPTSTNGQGQGQGTGTGTGHPQVKAPYNLETMKRKEDIIPLKEGIHALKSLLDKGKLDINIEQKNDIYLMIFLTNTLENGWSIRKKNDEYVFRRKHEKQTEIYSDEYLVNFLKSNMNNIIA